MNRSVTIVLFATVVWIAGLGETAVAGLKPQKRSQTEISSRTRPAKPEIVGDYVLIYKPQPDVYTGKDTKNYKAGQRYTNWQHMPRRLSGMKRDTISSPAPIVRSEESISPDWRGSLTIRKTLTNIKEAKKSGNGLLTWLGCLIMFSG